MKNTLAISCRKCGYEKDFYLGVGLLHSGAPDFDSEYAVLPRLVRDPEALARIKRMVTEEGGTLVTDYRYGVYHCPACGAFHKRFAYAVEKEAKGEGERRCRPIFDAEAERGLAFDHIEAVRMGLQRL